MKKFKEKDIKITGYDFKSLYPNKKELSSSQALSYEVDPEKFYIEYVLGVRREATKAMLVGSIFSELNRNRKYDYKNALVQIKATKRYIDIFERVIKRFPVCEKSNGLIAEYPLRCSFKGWTFRATLDAFSKSQKTIIENKTGQTEWTQQRANKSDQITFQNWVYWRHFKEKPKVTILNWVDLRPRAICKELHSYKTKRTLKQLKDFEERMSLVIDSIEIENWSQPLRKK